MEYEVYLENCGNPDHGQDPNRSLPGTESGFWVPAETPQDAAKIVRDYIDENDLGGGNWAGGEVRHLESKVTAGKISYNGRYWPAEDAPTAGPTPGMR